MKYKVGDMVIITNRIYGHAYNHGDIVKIIKVESSYYCTHKEGMSLWWYINDDECKRYLLELPKSIKTV